MNYKIVSYIDNLYYSYAKNYALSKSFQNRWVVEYKLNEWTKPNLVGSKLFYFCNMKDVNYFIKEYIGNTKEPNIYKNDEYYLFECEVKKALFVNPRIIQGISLDGVRHFWKYSWFDRQNYVYENKSKLLKTLPGWSQTIFGIADEIMLTRFIKII